MSQTDPTTPQPLLEISTPRAIALVRRWRWLSILLRILMVGVLVTAIWIYERGGGIAVVLGLFVLWTLVASLNARARRLAMDAGQFLAAGELDLAEDRLAQSLTSFSIVSSTKQIGLQQLALLRHAQSRWADAARLAQAFLAGRGGADVPAQLVLAESLLELGDLDGAARQLNGLSILRLNLRQTLVLTQLRLDLQARQGQYAQMFAQPQSTIGLIDLMPAPLSMRCHALLALAARGLGKTTWWHWLTSRASLLGDVESLFETRPFIREAFKDDRESSGPSDPALRTC